LKYSLTERVLQYILECTPHTLDIQYGRYIIECEYMLANLVKNKRRILLIGLGLLLIIFTLATVIFVSALVREIRVERKAQADRNLELLVKKATDLSAEHRPSVVLCENLLEHLESAVIADEGQVMPHHLQFVFWCFQRFNQRDDNTEEGALNALHEKLRNPRLVGTSFSFKSAHALLRKDYENALRYARESVRLLEIANRDYNNAFSFVLSEAYRSVGASYYYLSRFDDAIVYYRKAIDLHPKNHAALNGIGSSLFEKDPSNNRGVAKEYFLRALEAGPSSWRPLYNLAFVLKDTNPRESIKHATKLLSLYERFGHLPNLATHNETLVILSTRSTLARVYSNIGDMRAVESYEKAQAMVEDHRGKLLKIDETEDLQWVWEIEEDLENARVRFGL